MRILITAALLACVAPSTASAQATAAEATPAASTAGDIDPARLAVANRLALMMIAADGSGPVRDMALAAFDAEIALLRENDEFKTISRENAAARRLMDRLATDVRSTTLNMFNANAQAQRDDLAAAWARRFSVSELTEIEAFNASPVGRRLLAEQIQIAREVAQGRGARALQAAIERATQPIMAAFMRDVQALARK